jgi:DNA mismatch repair protein PMS2
LEELNTYGFRGEAISSLCAVSDVHITTAQEDEAPQGTRLDFHISGKLKSTSTVACQRGTTVFVQCIFKNLIVRRKELEKNIKREYTKVLNLLQAYACICTDVRISVSNLVGKQRKDAFQTKGNKTTRENVANVYGVKTLSALIPLNLQFEMQPSIASATKKDDWFVERTPDVNS